MEVLLPLCVIWDTAIKDFCTDFPQERMWVPWEATHQLIRSNQAISYVFANGTASAFVCAFGQSKTFALTSIKKYVPSPLYDLVQLMLCFRPASLIRSFIESQFQNLSTA